MVGRRKIGIDDHDAWVFNRMAHVYEARPAYPRELVDAVALLASTPDASVADLGAGTGHLAVPLAQRGLRVSAVEPAAGMLARLEQQTIARGLAIACLHAAAESLPLPSASVDLAIIADAMHFLDAALTGQELLRVLKPRAALAIVTCELGDTPFMRELVTIMEESAPRRPRAIERNMAQLASVARVALTDELVFEDHTPLDQLQLERVLRSISFIGPAMNRHRFADFWSRVRVLSDQPIWSRRFRLRSGRRT
jgi:ubiquinone/menaquinone biosynthesis C-methylase UbiE